MASAALGIASAGFGLDLLGGLFGYMASEDSAEAAESRGRMLRMEAEADAQRYSEQAKALTAAQGMAYVKSGVKLTGSPLTVIDNDILTAQENINAIRARGAAQALGAETDAAETRISGRLGLFSGLTGGLSKLAWASYARSQNNALAGQNRRAV